MDVEVRKRIANPVKRVFGQSTADQGSSICLFSKTVRSADQGGIQLPKQEENQKSRSHRLEMWSRSITRRPNFDQPHCRKNAS